MPKSATTSKPASRKSIAPKSAAKKIAASITASAKAKKLAPVPENVAWVSVCFAVKNPAAAIPWYEKAFGFTKKHVITHEGAIVHAELAYRNNTIMLGPESPEMKSYAPSTIGGTPVTFYVYTEDVDGLAARAKKAGATVLQEPVDQFWGDRIASFADPEGHKWTFAKRLRECDYDSLSQDGCCG